MHSNCNAKKIWIYGNAKKQGKLFDFDYFCVDIAGLSLVLSTKCLHLITFLIKYEDAFHAE